MLAHWDPDKVGLLLVAKITDGPCIGVLHIYDGGTRWAAQGLRGEDGESLGDPDYLFPCWVREMTELEAANAFLAFNTESVRPAAFYQYLVALEGHQPWALAVRDALRTHHLEMTDGHSIYGNGVPGLVRAVKACERIVLAGFRNSHATSEEDRWHEASLHLSATLALSRQCYTNDSAHDADLLQALSRLVTENTAILDGTKIIEIVRSEAIGGWRQFITSANQRRSASLGGSASRGITFARILAERYNRGRRNDDRKLRVIGEIVRTGSV
jgi:hypothetical protein